MPYNEERDFFFLKASPMQKNFEMGDSVLGSPALSVLVGLFIALLTSFFAHCGNSPSAAEQASPPWLAAEAANAIESMIASKIGIDRTDALWAFNAAEGALTVLTADGKRTSIPHVTDVRDVDVDSEWGMAALFRGGSELQVIPFPDHDSESSHEIVPSLVAPIDESSNVCWLASDLVALSPKKTTDRVLLFSLDENRVTHRLGKEDALDTAPGVYLVRTTLLRCDPTRKLVYSLNSFSGELIVYSHDGREVHRGVLQGTLHDQYAAQLMEQIAGQNAEIKKSGKKATSYRAFLNWEHFSIDSDGDVWAVDEIQREQRSLSLIEFKPSTGEQTSKKLTNEDCTSRHFALWKDRLILFRPPHYPIELCTVIRKEVI